MFSEEDHVFMGRALELAVLGKGHVSPNPMVGCVIVHEGKIIGEGFHRQYGKKHAEVNAIDSVKNPELLIKSKMYVTLEPCAHFGKTPPCANLIAEKQIPEVIICNTDPHHRVAGKGIAILNDNGIKVSYGLLEEEGRSLNKRFFTFHEKKRPYITIKWAQTSDGFIARENFDSKWISNAHSRMLVHKWRSEEMSILTGTNTAFYDNPTLNVRDWPGPDPLRLVLDLNDRLPKDLNLFKGPQKTVVFNLNKDEKKGSLNYTKVSKDYLLDDIVSYLHKNQIHSVFVEAGTRLMDALLEAGLWDEARIFISEKMFKNGIRAPRINGTLLGINDISGDQLLTYKNEHGSNNYKVNR